MTRENGESTALATQEERPAHALLRPVVCPAELVEYHKEVSALITGALEKGRDYGVIPGTGSKPSLYKAGAERVNVAFGTYPRYDVVEKEIGHDREVAWKKRKWDGQARKHVETSGVSLGLYRYVIRCQLVQRSTGLVVGDGIGSCSTMESKYIDRPRDLENTVVKMAQKRGLVAATLNAYALSDRFTQDVEDMGREQGQGQERAKAPRAAKAPPPATKKQRDELAKLLDDERLPAKWGKKITTMLNNGVTREDAAKIIGACEVKLEEIAAEEEAEALDVSTDDQNAAMDEAEADMAGEPPDREPGQEG